MADRWATPGAIVAGAAAALGASACCAGPLLLVLLGAGGAWASGLTALQPLQPLLLVAALGFFGYAFHRLYLVPAACAAGEACAVPVVRRRQRLVFWSVAAVAAALLAAPVYAPLFY